MVNLIALCFVLNSNLYTCELEKKEYTDKSIIRAGGAFLAGHLAGKAIDAVGSKVSRSIRNGNKRAINARRDRQRKEQRSKDRSTNVRTARFDP